MSPLLSLFFPLRCPLLAGHMTQQKSAPLKKKKKKKKKYFLSYLHLQMCYCAARIVFKSVWCDILTDSFPLPPLVPAWTLTPALLTPSTLKYYPTHLLNNALVVSPVQSLFLFRTRCLCFTFSIMRFFLFFLHSALTRRRNYFRPARWTGGRIFCAHTA